MKTTHINSRVVNESLPPKQARRSRVQAVETGMSVLKGLTYLGGRGNLKTLSDHVGQSPAKVHRYLASLMDEGLVAQDQQSQQYYLGAEAIQIGIAALKQADPVRALDASLIRLREEHGVTCFVAVMGNHGPTIIKMEEPGLPVTINVRIGSVLPLMWSATGRVFLALLDDEQVHLMATKEMLAPPASNLFLKQEHDSIQRIRTDVREHGMATVRDTYLTGISAVASPIYNHTGRVCAVLTALGASGGFDADINGKIARRVKMEAAVASKLLGYSDQTSY